MFIHDNTSHFHFPHIFELSINLTSYYVSMVTYLLKHTLLSTLSINRLAPPHGPIPVLILALADLELFALLLQPSRARPRKPHYARRSKLLH
jgi:hypothetical protein